MATVTSYTEEKILELMQGWEGVSEEQGAINAYLADVVVQLEANTAALEEFENQTLPALQADLTSSSIAVGNLVDVAIPNLQAELDANTADLNDLNTTVLPELQGSLSSNSDWILELNDITLPAMEQRIQDAEAAVATIDLTALENGLAAAQADIATLNDTTLPALDARLTQAEADVAAIDLTTLEANISAAQGDISTLQNTTLPALDTRIAAAEAEVSTLDDRFPIQASDIGFEIGGANIVPNSSFEDASLPGMFQANGAVGTSSTTQKRSGSRSLKAVSTVTGADSNVSFTYSVIPGEKYVVSAYVWVESLVGPASQSRGIFAVATNPTQGLASTNNLDATHPTGQWVRHSVSVTAPTSTLQVRLYSPNGTVYWEDLQVELGEVLTAYAPKPGEILAGTITAAEIADGAISTPKLVSGAVVADKIASGAVVAGKIAADAVTANEIAANAVTAGKIAANAVTATEILAGAITTSKLSAGAVTANEIAAGAITTVKLAANAVTANEIASNAVTAVKIQAGAVTAGKIAADAVTAAEIAAGAVTASEIAAGAVVAGKIAADAVTSSTILAGAITAGKIAADAVTANEIAAGAVTASEIAAGAVVAGKIAANAVTANEIAANAVTATQINANAVTAVKIATDAVEANKIKAGAITTAKLAAGAVTANEIAAGAITAIKIDAGAVTTAKLAAGAVTANEIGAEAVTALKIQAGAITTDHIVSAGIDASVITAGVMSGERIMARTLNADTIVGGELSADVALVGQIEAEGQGVVGLSGDRGFYVLGSIPSGETERPTLISFPVNGDPNIIAGQLTATTAVVTAGGTLYGEIGIGANSKLVLYQETRAPDNAPVLSYAWDSLQVQDTVSASTMGFKNSPNNGGAWTRGHDGKYKHFFISYNFATEGLSSYTTKVESWSTAGVKDASITSFYNTGAGVTPGNVTSAVYNAFRNCYHVLYWNDYNNDHTIATFDTSLNLLHTVTMRPQQIHVPPPAPFLGVDTTNGQLLLGLHVISKYSVFAYNTGTTGIPSGINSTSPNYGSTWRLIEMFAGNDIVYFEAGNFDFGAKRFVSKRASASKSWDVWTYVTSGTPASQGTYSFPAAGGTTVQDGWWNPSISRFQHVTLAGRIYTYESEIIHSGSTSFWAGYSWYDDDAGGGLHETGLSPLGSVPISPRARLVATVDPIPAGTGTDKVTKAKIYYGIGAAAPSTSTIYLRSTSASQVRTLIPGTNGASAASSKQPDFGVTTPSAIESADAGSYWKADNTAKFLQLHLESSEEASTAAGNKPALRIGNIAGQHLRIDSNEIIAMETDSSRVGGELELSADQIKFNFVNGGAYMLGTGGFAFKIRTENSNHTGLAFDYNRLVACVPAWNGETATANNTVNLVANNLIAMTDVTGEKLQMNSPGSGGGANVNYNSSNGYLRIATSSQRFKENIQDLEIDTEAALQLRPVIFQRNDEWSNDREPVYLGYQEDNPYYAGFVAEEAAELGFERFVDRDGEGEVFSFAYNLWTVALQAIAQKHDQAIKDAQSEIAELKTQVAQLLSR